MAGFLRAGGWIAPIFTTSIRISSFEVARGRDLCRLDVEKYNQVCVLGARAAKSMFDYADPLNQELTISGVPFTVVGVYTEKDKNSSYRLYAFQKHRLMSGFLTG